MPEAAGIAATAHLHDSIMSVPVQPAVGLMMVSEHVDRTLPTMTQNRVRTEPDRRPGRTTATDGGPNRGSAACTGGAAAQLAVAASQDHVRTATSDIRDASEVLASWTDLPQPGRISALLLRAIRLKMAANRREAAAAAAAADPSLLPDSSPVGALDAGHRPPASPDRSPRRRVTANAVPGAAGTS